MKFSFETINDDNKQTYKRCSETIGSWELEAGAVVLILNPITDIPQSRLFASTGWQRGSDGIYFCKKNGIPAQLVPELSFHDSILQNRAAAALSPLFLYSSRGRLGWGGTDILNTKLGWGRYTQYKTTSSKLNFPHKTLTWKQRNANMDNRKWISSQPRNPVSIPACSQLNRI